MPHLTLIEKQDDIKKAGDVFRAIGHPLIKKILELIAEKEQVKVTEIYVNLNLPQPVASMHLKILREAHIVVTQRKGKAIFYKVNYDHLSKLEKVISEIISD